MPLITNSSCLVAKKDFLRADLKVTRNSLHARLQMIPEQQTFSFPPDFWSVGITWKNGQESFFSPRVLGAQLSGRGCGQVYMGQAWWDLEIISWIRSMESAKPNDLFQENKSTLGPAGSRSGRKTDWGFLCLCRPGVGRERPGKALIGSQPKSTHYEFAVVIIYSSPWVRLSGWRTWSRHPHSDPT